MSEKQRKYYSIRLDKNSTSITFETLRKIILTIYEDFSTNGYFNEYFGSTCVDLGYVSGLAGDNLKNYSLRKLRKDIWPFDSTHIRKYSEEDLFDMIEFLYDHISKPLEEGGSFHNWGDCGWHYVNFDSESGKKEYIAEVNQFLNEYSSGYEISDGGEILSLADPQLQNLLNASIPDYDSENIESKMVYASEKFRKYGSSLNDRAESVRTLVDCLEFIRPELQKIITKKDESDLFTIANKFGIRHHDVDQKTNYDKNIWLSWMFYYYYVTLQACLRLIKKSKMEEEEV